MSPFITSNPRGRLCVRLGVFVLLVAGSGLSAIGQEKISPDEANAEALFDRQEWSKAAEGYRKVVDADPDNGRAWFRLGYCLHATGRLDDAIEAHKKATKAGFYRRVAWYNLGCAYALKGQKDEAFAALEKAVQVGFSEMTYLDTDSDLESLRADPRFAKLKERLRHAWPTALRALDFWVGTWDVFNKDGVVVGVNRIDKLEGGFLILEHWESTNGGTGHSTNYYDRDEGVWRQIWIAASGEVSTFAGNFEDGAMRYEGKSVKPNGSVEQSRIVLTPRKDGNVHHFSEQSRDGGKTWYVYFDGTYVRRGARDDKKTEARK